MREVEDMQALIAKTGAKDIFALSAGALVTLRTALETSALQRIALYEPPFSINGSTPTQWVARYDNELASGNTANALVSGMQGLATVPIFTKIPRFLLVPGLSLVMALQGKGTEDDVAIRSLVPTWKHDMDIIDEMSGTLNDYRNLSAKVLLAGGTKSPRWLQVSLEGLARVIPHVERVTFPGLGHDGPEDDANPEVVAKTLREFFTR
jgi:pimeloyl-ACP methyl ester carboxylesterase